MTTISPAPEWALIHAEGKARAVGGSVDAWLARTIPGKPTKAVRKAEARVTRQGMTHESMLEAATAIVRLGTEPGAGEAAQRMRTTYAADWPGYERHWDNALEGSIAEFGLPPVTFPLSKAERRALRERPTRPTARPDAGGSRAAEVGDDAGLAVILGDHFAPSLAHAPGLGWLEYDGRRWREASEAHVVELVRAFCEEEGVAAFRRREDRLAKWLRQGGTITRAAQLLKGRLERRLEEFDSHPDLLNVANGVVHLPSGELRPHNPALLLTKITRDRYVPGATHPDVTAALKALPRESRDWMQIRAGQAATGHTPDDDIVPILHGAGENAKSTWVSMLLASLGDYAALMPDKLLIASAGDHPTALMDLHGVRLAVSEELPEGHQLNVKRLKDIAGTPRMKARRMRQDFVEWSPTHSLWVSSNYQPRVAETDHGTWRRLALVRFPYRYVAEPSAPDERKADRRLRSRVTLGHGGRGEAVLAWVVEGARRWYDGRQLPPAPLGVVADTEEWREVSDSALAFANDRLVFTPEAHLSVEELAFAVKSWLSSNGQREWGRETVTARFNELFRTHGVTKTRQRLADGTRPHVWLGVGLRPVEPVLTQFVTQSHNR